MKTLFLQYPACSTCQKAKKWLTENNIEYTNRLIVDDNPTVEELKAWIPLSGLPVKKFFNTSGVVYKELKLSSKLPTMTEEEQIPFSYQWQISETPAGSDRALRIGRI